MGISFNTILVKAKNIKENVEKEQKLGESSIWGYYICKAILSPKTTKFEKVTVNPAPNPRGDYVSRQMYYSDYKQAARYIVDFVEKKERLPNFIEWKEFRVKPSVYIDMFSRILVYYAEHNTYPKKANVNSKAFIKPVETPNEVYDYSCKKFGRKFTSLDDILEFVAKYFTYEFYYDDHKSNKEVTDSKAGNCTDLLQWLCNMVEALGYEWKCVHVSCRVSGTGHVWGKFRHPKNTDGEWVNRDIACCAENGSIRCIWCEDGYVNAYNPSWWLANLRR